MVTGGLSAPLLVLSLPPCLPPDISLRKPQHRVPGVLEASSSASRLPDALGPLEGLPDPSRISDPHGVFQ